MRCFFFAPNVSFEEIYKLIRPNILTYEYAFITEWDSSSEQEDIFRIMKFHKWREKEIHRSAHVYYLRTSVFLSYDITDESLFAGYDTFWFTNRPDEVKSIPSQSLTIAGDSHDETSSPRDDTCSTTSEHCKWAVESNIGLGISSAYRIKVVAPWTDHKVLTLPISFIIDDCESAHNST